MEYREVVSSKAKRLLCDHCGKKCYRTTELERDKEDFVDKLYELWYPDGAVPVLRQCKDCAQEMGNQVFKVTE
jgi:hypothetical protein